MSAEWCDCGEHVSDCICKEDLTSISKFQPDEIVGILNKCVELTQEIIDKIDEHNKMVTK